MYSTKCKGELRGPSLLLLFNKQALGDACSSTIGLFQGKSDTKMGCPLDVASEKAPGGSQAPQVELQQQAQARIHGQQRRCQDVQGICCTCAGSSHSTGHAQHSQCTCTCSLASRQVNRHTDTCQAPNNRSSWHRSKRACQRPRQPHSAALFMLMICWRHLQEYAGEPKVANTHTHRDVLTQGCWGERRQLVKSSGPPSHGMQQSMAQEAAEPQVQLQACMHAV